MPGIVKTNLIGNKHDRQNLLFSRSTYVVGYSTRLTDLLYSLLRVSVFNKCRYFRTDIKKWKIKYSSHLYLYDTYIYGDLIVKRSYLKKETSE